MHKAPSRPNNPASATRIALISMLSVWVVQSAGAGEKLDGFGDIKFGMTISQAQAILANRQDYNLEHAQGKIPDTIRYTTIIDSITYRVLVVFNHDEVSRINVNDVREHEVMPEGKCRERFENLFAMVRQRYGQPTEAPSYRNIAGQVSYVAFWSIGSRHLGAWGGWDGIVSKCREIGVEYRADPYDRKSYETWLPKASDKKDRF